ncbi:general substrate transporter [Russula earlei]|uniref:General substrate transporter n=1 Tax=Russula earlei TaxID=71964 RepID=A0ACC0U0D1_9AGAM|nr:general substrate transporter [Russula earlei]
MLGGVALQATASELIQFIGARALVGAGLIFSTSAAPLLITELAYPTQRGKITSLYNSLWYGGSIAAAWSCLIGYNASHSSWSWRAPVLVQAFGPLLQLLFIRFVPESPRWLISQGSERRASRILARFHTTGFDERDPFVQFEMARIRHVLRVEKEMNEGASKRMRIIIGIALFSQWSGTGLALYYIKLVLESIGITSPRTVALISGWLQIWNFTAALIGALLVDKVGRRTLFIISNAGMLATLPLWALTASLSNTGIPASAHATIPFIFAFYLFYGVAYTPMIVSYTLELLPYSIRAKGFAFMNLVVSLALALSQFVDPWALRAIDWRYYLVYCGWLGFELVFVIVFVVETRGRTLEETAALFDGEERRGFQARAQTRRTPAVKSFRYLATFNGEQGGNALYPAKMGSLDYREFIQRPEVILGRDRLGHTQGRGVQFDYKGRT